MPDLEASRALLPPKLGEQIKALAEEWGEGFEEDIARPLAQCIKAAREGGLFKGILALSAKVEELEDELDDLKGELEIAVEAAHRERDREEELEDVARGVRTLEEVLERWRSG